MTTFYADVTTIANSQTGAEITAAWDRVRSRGQAHRAQVLLAAALDGRDVGQPWSDYYNRLQGWYGVRRAATLIGVAPPSVPPRTRPA